jgi:hypothetical protein
VKYAKLFLLNFILCGFAVAQSPTPTSASPAPAPVPAHDPPAARSPYIPNTAGNRGSEEIYKSLGIGPDGGTPANGNAGPNGVNNNGGNAGPNGNVDRTPNGKASDGKSDKNGGDKPGHAEHVDHTDHSSVRDGSGGPAHSIGDHRNF